MCKIGILDKLSFLLVLIGSLNWGTIGLFNLNIAKLISMNIPIIERFIYIAVFLGALDLVSLLFRCNLIMDEN
ncbi:MULTISPECIES: DUF378 domain-containing protein [Clostridium]|jgi:Domain of unknown function (DUF378).|uniref:DUF378 domain-containing protein n=4 Tax=Clostridium TaxID=1485 RepID=A0A0B5Q6X3_CLOBE|nr:MULTISPECIES: DUF378 domain-containing protein [Clostridium]ABR33402.1 hypothetical protein Cbei_1220 [Clostridium beijerinckii NCIMB 8052]AIU01254.1 hypothetical protein Cbs_1220 [Clostridium beijerinckii ATCC 35702]AJG97959.1 DUF378 domain-containing protein [Clostridium beijerinckii]ALB47449.1 DUF378 domain-containing protein [Clostridium beijerinckii NRRL B-598]AVK50276.1 DUF378 domain-containing protein [Clostridium sp. MF28]